jgi:multiple sugar transport system substrate-binding protein
MGQRVRRRGIAGILSVVACLLLSGCAQGWGFSGSGSNGKINLTYALWDPTEQIGYQKSIDEFEKLHPKIHVTIEQIPYGSYQPKLTAEFITHKGPDLFWVNTPFLGTWIKDKVMVNIAPKIKADHLDMSQYYPALVQLHQHGGKTYGLPKDWDTIALYYNKDYFAKYHVQIPKNLTWTPDGGGTFMQLLKDATIDTHGHNANSPQFDKNHIASYAMNSANDMQGSYLNFLASNGSGVFPKAYDQKVSFNSAKGIQTFQYLSDLINKYHVAVPGAELGPNADDSAALQVFARGEMAMYMAGDWNTNSIVQSTKFKIGVLPLPTGPTGRVSVFNGLIDAINVHSAHPKEAWMLEKWLGSAQSQKIMGEGGYIWPAIKSLDKYFLQAWQKKGLDLQPFLDEAEGQTVNWPVSPGMGEALTDMGQALGPIYLGSSSVPSAIQNAADAANHDLSTGAQ